MTFFTQMNTTEIVFLISAGLLCGWVFYREVTRIIRVVEKQPQAQTAEPLTVETEANPARKNETLNPTPISPSSRGGVSMSSIFFNGQQVISYSDDGGCISVHAQDGNVMSLIHNGLDVDPASEEGQALLHKVRFLK